MTQMDKLVAEARDHIQKLRAIASRRKYPYRVEMDEILDELADCIMTIGIQADGKTKQDCAKGKDDKSVLCFDDTPLRGVFGYLAEKHNGMRFARHISDDEYDIAEIDCDELDETGEC